MAKGKKLDFKKIAMKTLIVGGTSAVAQVIAKAVEGEVTDGSASNQDVVTYGMIAAGIILPEVVKSESVATAGDALLAIGAYRMAEQYDLGAKLGINGIGVPGSQNIGSQKWEPIMRAEKSDNKVVKPSSNMQ